MHDKWVDFNYNCKYLIYLNHYLPYNIIYHTTQLRSLIFMLKNNCCDLFFSDTRKSAMNCLYVTHSFRTSLIRWILINVILYPSGRDKWKLNVSIVMVVMSCIIYRKCGINRIKMCCMRYIRNSSWIIIQLTIANKIRYSWTNSKHISNNDIANNKNVNISFLFFSAEELADLNDRLIGLQQAKDAEKEEYESQLSALRGEYQEMKDQLTSENMILG